MDETSKTKTLDEVIEEAMQEATSNGDTHAPEGQTEVEEKVEDTLVGEDALPEEPAKATPENFVTKIGEEEVGQEENAEEVEIPQEEIDAVFEKEEPNAQEELIKSAMVGNEDTGIVESAEPEAKTFSQDEVNSLVGSTRKEARDKVLKELFGQYGVAGREELDDVFGKGQAYDLLNEDYTNLSAQLKELQAENALLKSNIDRDRWDDAKAILNSKGMDITSENILAMAETHPEWLPKDESRVLSPEDMEELVKAREERKLPKETPSIIKKFGVDVDNKADDEAESEEKRALKMFGL